MATRSPAMRRADRRSLLLLTLAIAPIVLVIWFSMQQWNENGRELRDAAAATGPVTSLYESYSFVDLLARTESTLVAASLPGASPELLALAADDAAHFEARINDKLARVEAIVGELADQFGEDADPTLELVTLAGAGSIAALRGYEPGDPAPAILGFVVGPGRDQLVSVVAPTVSSHQTAIRDYEQLFIELLRLDAAYDSDLRQILAGQRSERDLELHDIRLIQWNETSGGWTLALSPDSDQPVSAGVIAGAITSYKNPITPAIVGLAELDADGTLDRRNELIVAALQNEIVLSATMDEAHQSLLDRSSEIQATLRRARNIAALAGVIMTALGIALFWLIVTEIRGRRRVARAHDEALNEMAEVANRDALTGLRNRRWLDIELPRALAERAPGEEVGIVYLDVDRFKGINDVWGHDVGDVILRVIAQRMQRAAGQLHDFELVRFGGDEFVGLAKMPPGSGDDDLGEIGRRLLGAFADPISYEGRVHKIDSSIGLTRSMSDSTPHSLLVESDLSLLDAKRSGRGRSVVYQRHGNHVGELVQALPGALAGGEFDMHLQPVVDAITGEVVHYEALARWTRPGGETISPAVFVPLIESFGLADGLTRAMFMNVKDLLVRADRPLPRIWVNVSPVEFNGPNLSGRLLKVLDEVNLAPSQIGIEMTERSAIGDLDGVEDELQRLRDHGVQIAIDDFGAGYSPLGHLRDLPVDVLKIDRSLIADLHTDDGAQQMVRGIIGFARSLGLSLVAEGVELAEELAVLRAEGIDMVQGHLTGRPAPADDVLARLADHVAPLGK